VRFPIGFKDSGTFWQKKLWQKIINPRKTGRKPWQNIAEVLAKLYFKKSEISVTQLEVSFTSLVGTKASADSIFMKRAKYLSF